MAAVTSPQAGPALRRGNWGTLSYLFMRGSGVLLAFLVIIHFVIQHVINDVYTLDLNFVAQRWSNPGWRVYDAFMLTLALAHGLNGSRIVANDYILHPAWNRAVNLAILAAGLLWIVVGGTAIIGGVRFM
jgi:succinate dehydrogenase / fumarate reductase membrane anchor subunit